MTEDHDRTRLDGVIDDVVRDMMQVEPRDGLAGRVRHAIDEPAPRRWRFAQPAFAAAALVLVALAGVLLMPGRTPTADVPALTVVSGPPVALDATIPAPNIPAPPAAAPGRATATAAGRPQTPATAESIFGERGSRVSAASVRSRVRLVVTLTDVSSTAAPTRQELSLVTGTGERREVRSDATARDRWLVAATPHVLATGDVRLHFEILDPVQARVEVTLTPGKRIQITEGSRDGSGRRYAVDAVATVIGGVR